MLSVWVSDKGNALMKQEQQNDYDGTGEYHWLELPQVSMIKEEDRK